MSIDKDKLVADVSFIDGIYNLIKDIGSNCMKEESKIIEARQMLIDWKTELTDKINSGEFDCEAGNSCIWTKAFDANFNISCANETGQRASSHFKGVYGKWQFTFCPYCGGKIKTG